MFNFFIKKYSKPLFKGLCDIHNHLLPGIDDGSKNMDESYKMLNLYQKLGFKSIIPTPHIYKDLYPNTPETIRNSFKKLIRKNNFKNLPNIPAYAAEYMIDEIFLKKIEIETPKLLLPNNYILVEINFFGDTELLEKACFKMSQKNINSILAHPERYNYIETIQEFKNLKQKGLYFQLNSLSLLGYYGPHVKQKAQHLLKEGLYDFLATDAHNSKHLELLSSLKLSRKEGLKWELISEFQLEKFQI